MKMLTVTETAKALGVTPTLIRIYIKRGLFPGAVKVRGTRWKIPAAQVELFDGVDVSGAYTKTPKVPFCVMRKKYNIDRVPSWGCFVNNENGIAYFHLKKECENFTRKINEAAEAWVKNA